MRAGFVLASIILLLLLAAQPARAAESAAAPSLDSARAALDAGKLDIAEGILFGMLEADWFDSDVHTLLAEVRKKEGFDELAVASAEQAVLILIAKRFSGGADVGTEEDRARLLPLAEGLAYQMAPDPVIRLRWSEAAFFLGSSRSEVLRPLAADYISFRLYGHAYEVLNRAIAAYSPAGERDETAADLHHLLGIVHYYLGDFAGSDAEYALADKYGLATIDFYGDRGFTFEGLGKWTDALAMWERVSKMDVPLENKSLVEEHLKLCKDKVSGG